MPERALMVRGHQGVGKTTFAKYFAERYGFCRLSKDDIYTPILEYSDNHRLASDIAYMAIHSVLSANRYSNVSFVIDAPFNGPVSAPDFLKKLQELGFAAKSVLLVCSDRSLWEQRLQARIAGSTRPQTVTSLEQIQHFRGTLEAQPMEGELVLDTSQATVGNLAEASFQHLLGVGGDHA